MFVAKLKHALHNAVTKQSRHFPITGDDYHEDQLLSEMAFFGISGNVARYIVSDVS
jgi:hypothetical protein